MIKQIPSSILNANLIDLCYAATVICEYPHKNIDEYVSVLLNSRVKQADLLNFNGLTEDQQLTKLDLADKFFQVAKRVGGVFKS